MSKAKQRQRHATMKAILVFELIVSYMALLTMISHARAPEVYRAQTDQPILTASDFLAFSGETAEGELIFQNDVSGVAVGYQGDLQLTGVERVCVSFSIRCPEAYAGRTVYVDLYNYESGYDSPEQEVALTLREGSYPVEPTLFPGEGAPDSAKLRIFTVESADYLISNVIVCEETPMPKVSTAVYCVAIVVWLCTLITAVYCWRRWINEGGSSDERAKRNGCEH